MKIHFKKAQPNNKMDGMNFNFIPNGPTKRPLNGLPAKRREINLVIEEVKLLVTKFEPQCISPLVKIKGAN